MHLFSRVTSSFLPHNYNSKKINSLFIFRILITDKTKTLPPSYLTAEPPVFSIYYVELITEKKP